MSYEFVGFTPQGWQCPICGAVWSPSTMMCYNCTGKKTSFTVSSGVYENKDINEYLKQYLHAQEEKDTIGDEKENDV